MPTRVGSTVVVAMLEVIAGTKERRFGDVEMEMGWVGQRTGPRGSFSSPAGPKNARRGQNARLKPLRPIDCANVSRSPFSFSCFVSGYAKILCFRRVRIRHERVVDRNLLEDGQLQKKSGG
jgi:hypothetical protein